MDSLPPSLGDDVRDILDAVGAVVWEAEYPTWQFQYVSRAGESLLGYPLDRWRQPDFWPSVVQAGDWAAICDLDFRQDERLIECRVATADGDTRWLQLRFQPSTAVEADSPSMIRGVMLDVTSQRKRESAIRQRQELLQSIFDQAAVGVVQIDSKTGVIERANRHYAAIVGAEPDRLAGEDWNQRTHPDDLADNLAKLDSLRAGEISEYTTVKRLRHLQGGERWVRMHVSALCAPSEKPARHVAVLEDITERRRSREEINQLSLAVENAMQGISRLDRDGRFVMVKPKYAAMLGYAPEEMIGESWEVTVPTEDHSTAGSAYAEMLECGRGECECRARRKDGSIFFKRILLVKSFDEDQQFNGHYCFMRDVTVATEAQRSLNESRDQLAEQLAELELLYRTAPIGLCMLDTDLRFLRINDVLAEINGPSAEEHIGRSIDEVLPDLATTIRPIYERVIATGEPVLNFDVERSAGLASDLTGDGGSLFYLVSYYPLTNAAGQTIAVSAVVQDVTDQRRIDRAIRESEQKFRQLTEQSTTAIFITRGEQVLYCNPTARAVTGSSRDRIHKRGFAELVHPDDRSRAAQHLMEDSETASPQRSEVKLLQQDEGVRWVDIASQRIDFQGQPARLLTCVDITDRKIAEQKLRRMDAQLTHVSRLSTMGEMVAGIAHEINQPLSAIANYSLACQNALEVGEHAYDDRVATWLENISLETGRCGDIIRRLRSFVRKDDDQRELVDLQNAVHESIALIRSDLEQRAIQIDFVAEETSQTVLGNSVEIRQVLVNLIRNACEAARGREEPRVTVVLRTAGERVIVTVEDNGPGVPEGNRWHIFDAFYTTKSKGMGMGLAISRSIAESHQGNLRFEPAEPSGARFHFELPIASAASSKLA